MQDSDRTEKKEYAVTTDEWKMIRKALQCVSTAHAIVETAEGTLDRETPIDVLIRKVRAYEEGLTEPMDDGRIEVPDCE